MKSILLIKKFLGVVEMTFGLVDAKAVKMTFSVPCIVMSSSY